MVNRKFVKTNLILFLFVISLISCSKKDDKNNDNNNLNITNNQNMHYNNIVNINRDIQIIATLGKNGWENIPAFFNSGASILRINGSHIKNEQMFVETLENIKRVVKENHANINSNILNDDTITNTNKTLKPLHFMYDTQGPEIRTRIINNNPEVDASYLLKKGDIIVVHTNINDEEIIFNGDLQRVENKAKEVHIGINYKEFIDDVSVNTLINIENRSVYAQVQEIDKENNIVKLLITSISNDSGDYCLTDRRHINLMGKTISQPILTDADKRYIQLAIDNGIKYFAISFVKNKADVEEVYNFIRSYIETKYQKYTDGIEIKGSPDESNCLNDNNCFQNYITRIMEEINIIPKIENRQGVDNVEEILTGPCVHGVMVARGDLSSEITLEEVPYAKAKIITACKNNNQCNLSILATDVLESITRQAIPSNNDLDTIASSLQLGVDALMLSNETAQGAKGAYAIQEIMKQIQFYKNNNYLNNK